MKSRDLVLLVALTALLCGLLSLAHAAETRHAAPLGDQTHVLDFSKTVPGQLNYQGYLTDASDSSAVTTALEMTFRLFDSETKGAELWSETHPAVEVSNGLFQVLLGSITSFPAGLFDGSEMWLQTEVSPEVLAPRKPLVSVAYSQRTADADHANTADWASDAQHALHADTAAYSPSADAWTVSGDNVYRETGKVGIGTASPSQSLEVNGAVSAATYYGNGSHLTGISGTTDNDWDISGDDVYHQTGNVGIGTTNPALGRLEALASSGTGVYGGSNSGMGIFGYSASGQGVVGSSNSGHAGYFLGDVYISGDVNADSLFRIDGNPVLATRGYNTYVGTDAGLNNTNDVGTFVGYKSGHDNSGFVCTFVGAYAGRFNKGSWNTFVGVSTGDSTTGNYNTFLGYEAGRDNTSGWANTLVGSNAGNVNTTGQENTFLGHFSGLSNTTGSYNTFVGADAGLQNETSSGNTFLGSGSGEFNTTSNNNTYLGAAAGHQATGSGNVFVGYQAGFYESGSNKLYIANGYASEDVLIYGDFSTSRVGLGTLAPAEKLHLHTDSGSLGMRISSDSSSYQYINFGATKGYGIGCDGNDRFFLNREQPLGTGTLRILTALSNGKVGIGTSTPEYQLDVAGDINTTGDIRKNGSTYNHPDYVFDTNYTLISLEELKSYVAKNKHLPGMPTADEVREDGVKLFEQNRLIMEKLEEAYLYILALEERITELEDSKK